MVSIDDLPVFESIKPKFICFGAEGYVYRSSDSLAIKVPLEPLNELVRLENENMINYRLYYGGVAVPQPVGLFKIAASSFPRLPLFYGNSGYVPALVRKYVDGRSYDQLFPWQKEKAVTVFEEERLKAIELGFIPRDCYPTKNCLYTVKGWSVKSVTLFDFSLWTVRE